MRKTNFPPIGNRIYKSAAAVLICGIIYFLRGQRGIPFYSMLAALWCIQPYSESTSAMVSVISLGV